MAIEIYAYDDGPSVKIGTLTVLNNLGLHAVAPLEMRDQVEIWCAEKNKEAAEAGVTRRFKYQATAVEIFWEGYHNGVKA